ncbi:rod shape-determining protein MreC [Anaeromicropila populeti]|uniref:Cell shape-determining protein MreC n=1 Tax=Anaeromicropila populeti TaxID=37658 RepID=A0A1I6L7R1_9FIRM|nr:rod shape-determining protein MreC [Anaeromicropila populeti]SFR99543.1 rod shape-determining protein MreC [Anaeromicropila populeti]
MRRKTKFSVNPKYVLIGFFIICIILIFISFRYTEKVQPVKTVVSDFFTPMQNGINSVGSWITDKTEMITTMKKLQDENNELKEKLDTISNENKMLQLDKYELDSLRELYELDQKYTEYPKVAARIISKEPGNWYYQFTIDKGTNDGFSAGMNVMAGDGLVGIIVECNHNNSVVRSIIDDRSNVTGMILKTSDICNVRGNLELIDDGRIEIEDLDKSSKAKDGYEVVTSNYSPRYLPGILIGYIEDITVDPSNLTKSGYLVPAVNFDKLDTVLVITQVMEENY